MKVFNLHDDLWDEPREREGWRIKEAFVGEQALKEGDVVCFPRGEKGAHQIINGTESPIRVLMLSSMVAPDIVHYPDTEKVSASSAEGEPIMLARRGPTLEYWEGEE
jgi:uncharacterized cupin superfamily protein